MRRCVAVVAQEDLLEVVVAAADRAHLVGGDGLDQRVGRALEGDDQVPPVERRPPGRRGARAAPRPAGTSPANSISSRWTAIARRFSSESTTTSRPRRRIATRSATRSTSRQRVRGQEHRAALRGDLAEQRVEALLHQRVEPGDRLVEDQQLRLVHERLDQPELLAVARRELAHRAVELGVEALGQLVADPPVDAAAQLGRGSRASPPRSASDRGRSRPAGTRPGGGSRGSAAAVQPEQPSPSPTSAGSGPAAAAWSSTCRRRSDRGTRTPRRGESQDPGRRARAPARSPSTARGYVSRSCRSQMWGPGRAFTGP